MHEVSSFWSGSELSWVEQFSIASFLRMGYKYKLYCFGNPPLGIPEGVDVLSSDSVIRDGILSEIAEERPALASDLFRYTLLSCQDTIWVDTDVINLGTYLPQTSYLFGHESEVVINTGVLRYPQNSTLARSLIAESFSNIEGWRKLSWGFLGPQLLTKTVKQVGHLNKTLPKSVFFEVTPFETWKFFDPKYCFEINSRTFDSYAIHIWNNVLIKSPLNLKKYRPPEHSFIWNLINELELSMIVENLPPFPPSCNLMCWKKELKPPFLGKRIIKSLRRRLRTGRKLINV